MDGARRKRETSEKVERGLRVRVAVHKHLRLVLRTQPRSVTEPNPKGCVIQIKVARFIGAKRVAGATKRLLFAREPKVKVEVWVNDSQ